MANKPIKIKMFSGSYTTMCAACHECRKKYTAPCEKLWASGECVLPTGNEAIEKFRKTTQGGR